jgi:hypothetical protein
MLALPAAIPANRSAAHGNDPLSARAVALSDDALGTGASTFGDEALAEEPRRLTGA